MLVSDEELLDKYERWKNNLIPLYSFPGCDDSLTLQQLIRLTKLVEFPDEN